MAKKPTHKFRLQTMSVHELTSRLIAVRLRLNAADVKHRGRKLLDGPMLNAVVAWFLSRPEANQDAIVIDGLRRFEAVLNGKPDALSPDPSSIPADDDCPIRRVPGIGIRVEGGGLEHVDGQSQDEPAKPPRKP